MVYGVLNDWWSFSTLDHLILSTFYTVNVLEEAKEFHFADYINFVYEKNKLEKYNSVMTNTQTAFVKKWCWFLE